VKYLSFCVTKCTRGLDWSRQAPGGRPCTRPMIFWIEKGLTSKESNSAPCARSSRESRWPNPCLRKAWKPRSRNSCNSPSPATCAGPRISLSMPFSRASWPVGRALAGLANQQNLALTLRLAADRPVGRGVGVFVDALDQPGRHSSATIAESSFGQRVEFDGQGHGAQRRTRQHLDQQRQNALDLFVAAAEVLRAVEVGEKELRRLSEARAGQQVGMRTGQSPGLPLAQAQAMARGGRLASLACWRR
jgi:hypothetical protein